MSLVYAVGRPQKRPIVHGARPKIQTGIFDENVYPKVDM